MITPADLPAEFAAVPDAVAKFWIAAAVAQVETRRWVLAGADPVFGVTLLASHLLKAAGLGSDPGSGAPVIASESIGGVSVSMQNGTEANGSHASSTYGRTFDDILSRVWRAPRSRPLIGLRP